MTPFEKSVIEEKLRAGFEAKPGKRQFEDLQDAIAFAQARVAEQWITHISGSGPWVVDWWCQ